MPFYTRCGRTANWGADLTPDEMQALREGEILILLGEEGRPHSELLMDNYGLIRERATPEARE